MKLDKSKPYGLVCGKTDNNCRFIQGGHCFAPDGSLIDDEDQVDAEDATEVTEDTEQPKESPVDLENTHHLTLRKMVIAAGGEYTDRESAIAFLRDNG